MTTLRCDSYGDSVNRGSQLSRGVVLLLALAVFINMVDRGNLATSAPLLKDELGLTNSQMGVLLSAFFWVYAPALPLAGWIAHRFDVRLIPFVAPWRLLFYFTKDGFQFLG